ncbi:MAG: pyrrolo-quinoline quinone [Terriglobia bacterium]|nr:MAG: pyrrolo-quinoline quinone [Terriglobia bacterium]
MKNIQIGFLLAGCLAVVSAVYSQSAKEATEWRVYNGSPGGSHYSSLKQINQSNVGQLQVAWTYDAGDVPGTLETNPIVVNGVLYGNTTSQKVFALNAATGKEIWIFPTGEGGRGGNRGLAYWGSGSDQRIFESFGRYLYAIDANTGKRVASFGTNGRIDLQEGLRGDTTGLGAPAAIYKDLLITGNRAGETSPASPGDIRAYDARTGKLRWVFHTIPHPGEFGYDTWPKDAWTYIGNAGDWMGMSLDEKHGIVFVPTANADDAYVGTNRLGDNLFATSLVALNAETGERIWHFQTVKHDLWDRDVPAPPTLVTVKRDGKDVEAVAQITKTGHVFLFERTTGKPLFPIEYRRYPASTVPGEVTSETQGLPTKPAPFARQLLTEDMLTNRTPEAHQAAVARFRQFRSEGQFIPPSVSKETIMFPGMDGGGEWGGAAFDPETGLLYVNSNEMAWLYALVKVPPRGQEISGRELYVEECGSCHREDRTGAPPQIPSLIGLGDRMQPTDVRSMIFYGSGRMPSFATLPAEYINAIVQYVTSGQEAVVAAPVRPPSPTDTPFRSAGYLKFLDIDGYPAISPPWGTLNAINLNTGDYAWKIPLGEYPELAEKGMKNTGTENYGGPIVTAGGLVFIAATNYDKKLRAFDKKTGKLLWETTLPFPGNATPATYEVDGRQFIVIATSGNGILHNQRNIRGRQAGASYVAFALPTAAATKKNPQK